MRKNYGFTIVELLTVIAIFLIIYGIAAQIFPVFQKEGELSNSTEKIINILRLGQSKTLASEGASQYGVYFDTATNPHRYILFKGANYASREVNSDEVHEISKSVEIYEIILGGGQEVVFTRLTGETANPGRVSLRLKSDNSKTKTIGIQSSGKITLGEEALPSDSNRTKDSRHVHFNLVWSIQNATTLKFYFPDIPQTETVDMAGYFNAGKTEFNWEGTFSVGGVDRAFRLHTHFLDISSTMLCIHRDRNNETTNQEVIISIVDLGIDKDIAHYLADSYDTVNVGTFGGTMEIQ